MYNTYTLNVWCSVAVDLVAREHHHIRLLFIQNAFDEIQGPRVCIAVAAVSTLGLRISARAQTCAEMQIRDLHDLEFAILPDLGNWFLDLVWCASTYAQARVLAIASSLQMQCTILDQLPPRAWIYCVRSK